MNIFIHTSCGSFISLYAFIYSFCSLMKKIALYIAGCIIAVCSMFLSTFLIALFSGDPVNYNFDHYFWIAVFSFGLCLGYFLSRDKISDYWTED